ncbi:intermembrane phospholipid transport protein YdbH family protein [Roseospira navarrensis]|uniref:Dicarboxylate transport domain-containing protein n=1 Tax=Roseospira navarrensis TaxID=140058 RepID=A0A7X2D2N4_9PROT|nr:YdbH domain-containing protein [Roseospira navarrensis]MQX35963.1 hypothetical protein [Roseospira navarrensis]
MTATAQETEQTDEPAEAGPPARIRRRPPLWRMVARDVLLLPVLVAGLVWLGWDQRIRLADAVAPHVLARAGVGPARVSVEVLDPDRVVVSGLSLAGGRVRADHVMARLNGLSLDEVTVTGLHARAAWDPETGLDAGPFTAMLRGGGGADDADDADDAGGDPASLPVSTVEARDIRLALDTPWGLVRVLGDASMQAGNDGTSPGVTADLTASGAGVYAAASVRGRPMNGPNMRGDVALQVEPRDRPGLARDLAAHGMLSVDWNAEGLRVETDGLEARAAALDPALLSGLPSAVGALAEGPLSLTLAPGADGAPVRVTVPLNGAAPTVRGRVTADSAGAAVAATVDLTLNGPPALDSLSGTLADVSLRGTGLAALVPVATLADLSATLTSRRLAVADATLTGPFALTAEATALDHDAVTADAARLESAGTATLSLETVALRLETGALDLTAPVVPGVLDGTSDVVLALAEGRPQTLDLDLAGADAPALTLDVALAPVSLSGPVTADLESVTASGRVPWTDAAPLTASATAGSLRSGPWTLADLAVDLTLRPAGPTVALAGGLPRLPGESAGTPVAGHPLRPLRLEATLAPDPDDPARFAVDARVGAPLRDRVVTATGWIGRDGQDGTVRLTGRPITLGRDGVQPWHLYGSLTDLSTSAGSLAVEGTLSWRDGGAVRPDLSFGLAEVEAAYGATGLQNLNGVVRLTGLAPPRSPSQELVAAGLTMGLAFSDLVVRYRLDGAGAFVLEEATMRFAGGDITTDSATIPLTGFERIPLTLTVRGIELSELAAMTPIDDLSVSGTVDGLVPMVITPGDVRIDTGRLAAIAPGVVQYSGTALPAGGGASQGVDLAARALEDFRYTDLSMTVEGSTADEMSVGLRLEGANAQVLDGYPFQLNLNVSGPLTRIIQEGLQGYTIPERIKERLSRLGLDPP